MTVTLRWTDFEELLELVKAGAGSPADVPRPSKVRRMFASRACRKSVMFGRALNANQMTTVRRRLSLALDPGRVAKC